MTAARAAVPEPEAAVQVTAAGQGAGNVTASALLVSAALQRQCLHSAPGLRPLTGQSSD